MQKYLILLAAFFVSCSPRYISKAVWQAKPVSIDARATEYESLRYGNSDTKILYSVFNDSANLYICLTTSDEITQRQIMMAGLEVWVDTVKRPVQRTGIKYPLKVNQMPDLSMKPKMDSMQKPDLRKMQQRFLLNQSIMEISGFKNYPDGLSPLETKGGLKAKLGWDSNAMMVYEIQIPLDHWYRKIASADSNKIFTLTVNIKALPMPHMGNMPQGGPPGGNASGGPPMGGGGMPQGMPPMGEGEMSHMSAMSEPHSFSMNFKLNMHAK